MNLQARKKYFFLLLLILVFLPILVSDFFVSDLFFSLSTFFLADLSAVNQVVRNLQRKNTPARPFFVDHYDDLILRGRVQSPKSSLLTLGKKKIPQAYFYFWFRDYPLYFLRGSPLKTSSVHFLRGKPKGYFMDHLCALHLPGLFHGLHLFPFLFIYFLREEHRHCLDTFLVSFYSLLGLDPFIHDLQALWQAYRDIYLYSFPQKESIIYQCWDLLSYFLSDFYPWDHGHWLRFCSVPRSLLAQINELLSLSLPVSRRKKREPFPFLKKVPPSIPFLLKDYDHLSSGEQAFAKHSLFYPSFEAYGQKKELERIQKREEKERKKKNK